MDDDLAIKVENVSKVFKLPHEKSSSIKSAAINFYRYNKKGYELQYALKNISFEVKKGEFFGIVGRNGSGKSTLLKLLAGIYSPTGGAIQTSGSLTPFIELGVGFNPELTGRENVFLNGALLGFSRKEMQKMYKDIVSFAELEKFMDQKLKNYSSGMQVRLAFSIAIRAKGDILLIDEVLAVGDAAFQQKCYNHFEELKRQNRTVVFVSHDMGAIKRFCTRAIYVSDGKIVQEGLPSDMADLYTEANINTHEDETVDGLVDDQLKLSKEHNIAGRIVKQDDNGVLLKISYKSKNDKEMYIGISVTKDGVSIAEIATSLEHPLVGGGEVTYLLDTNIFNAGIYRIGGISLFQLSNRELLAVNKIKNEFVIKGSDNTRGGAIKLEDTWNYEKN